MKSKIYIAGPMTGYKNYNFDKFYNIEKFFNDKNILVVNPARITDENGGQEKFLNDKNTRNNILKIQREAIRNECYGIFLLKGWENSIGTKEELKIALENNLKIEIEK